MLDLYTTYILTLETAIFFRSNNILSTLYLIIAGILLGSGLGPNMFNLFFSDIPRTLKIFIGLYLASTAIYSAANHPYYLYKKFHNHIEIFISWCILWRVKFYESKTDAVYLSKKILTIVMV